MAYSVDKELKEVGFDFSLPIERFNWREARVVLGISAFIGAFSHIEEIVKVVKTLPFNQVCTTLPSTVSPEQMVLDLFQKIPACSPTILIALITGHFNHIPPTLLGYSALSAVSSGAILAAGAGIRAWYDQMQGELPQPTSIKEYQVDYPQIKEVYDQVDKARSVEYN